MDYQYYSSLIMYYQFVIHSFLFLIFIQYVLVFLYQIFSLLCNHCLIFLNYFLLNHYLHLLFLLIFILHFNSIVNSSIIKETYLPRPDRENHPAKGHEVATYPYLKLLEQTHFQLFIFPFFKYYDFIPKQCLNLFNLHCYHLFQLADLRYHLLQNHYHFVIQMQSYSFFVFRCCL